jgi:hypothetical protein
MAALLITIKEGGGASTPVAPNDTWGMGVKTVVY